MHWVKFGVDVGTVLFLILGAGLAVASSWIRAHKRPWTVQAQERSVVYALFSLAALVIGAILTLFAVALSVCFSV